MSDISQEAKPGRAELPSARRWEVLGRRPLYESKWVNLALVKVAPPGREPYEHHVTEVPDAVGVVLCNAAHQVLLLHRHRFITDTAGYEIPAGGIDDSESVEQAAAREVLEEVGWTVRDAAPMFSCNVSDGVSDQRFHFVLAQADRYAGPPVDEHESTSRVWVDPADVEKLIKDGEVPGALSTVALLYALHFQHV
ncbi:NUDIX hydrolase [Streptomyces sp. NPDC102384]|uniref:NUDIX hydrolase n=1 Tax=Streptomyces sp. NPDC102384 TaxID=3366166 RepID=UPI00381F208A